ncbi:uncharacterized protein [Venturia canescens]|uniref:uncharacterized protein n=1 Tax=Venturia canescens TaxID=32260 RepID=UPI001C9CFABA|nr:uncharacterized protein LOC122406010 [Venturia canescens]
MYRNGKSICASGISFVPFPLIFVYLATATVLLDVEGAETSPSERDIQEAQKIVGQFLRDEAGTDWLSGLAKTSSTPLTTPDLMNAILQITKRGDPVWEAATILLNALNSPNAIIGSRIDLTSEQSDNWKDMISKIEMEDDIICLYRKNGNETTKRDDDWKKFLSTVSPGYTVHLAIDTGLKYIICLKKIKVSETTNEASSMSPKTLVTNRSKAMIASVKEVTSDRSTVGLQSPVPSVSGEIKNIPAGSSTEMPHNNNIRRNKQIVKKMREYNDDNVAANSERVAKNSIRKDKTVAIRRTNEILRKLKKNDASSGSPKTCQDESDKRFNDPTVFVILNRNDFLARQHSPQMSFPIFQSYRCLSNPLDPRLPNDLKGSRGSFYDYANRWPLTDKHRSSHPNNPYLRKNVLYKKKLQNNRIARRTSQRFRELNRNFGKSTKIVACHGKPVFQDSPKRTMMINSVEPYHARYGNLPGLMGNRYFYKNVKIGDKNNAGRRSPPLVQRIHRSSGLRQPIVERSQSWVRDDYDGPIQRPLTKSLRPVVQSFLTRPPKSNLRPFGFIGWPLKFPCRNGHCEEIYRKSPFYVAPRPFPIAKPLSKMYPYHHHFPIVYSENLFLNGGNLESMRIPDEARQYQRPCDKSIKLQVLINGKVQEPLKVAVLSDIGQKLDVLGSDGTIMFAKPRTSPNEFPNPTEIPDDTNTYFETEINTRMDLQSSDPKETSLTESGLVQSDGFKKENNKDSTTDINVESTTLNLNISHKDGMNFQENSSQRAAEQTTTDVGTTPTTTQTTTIMSSTTTNL